LTQSSVVHVAVGMLVRADGAVLMASRPGGKPYQGYWEFPGGKLEAAESASAALARELQEEIGIDVQDDHHAWDLEHVYAHAHVMLHFHWVLQWGGEPHCAEGQQLLWVASHHAWPYPVLPATLPYLSRIRQEAMAIRSCKA
jgi:8-oxo-dGTP diphosphatase